MTKMILLLLVLFAVASCNTYSQSRGGSSFDARTVCNRVGQIKTLPIKGEPGQDAAYDALIAAGNSVVPCLIEKITNLTPVKDPRCLFSERTTVGDLAYWVVMDITKVDLLPADVQEQIESRGAYAYSDWIKRRGARRLLQSRYRDWWRQNHPSA